MGSKRVPGGLRSISGSLRGLVRLKGYQGIPRVPCGVSGGLKRIPMNLWGVSGDPRTFQRVSGGLMDTSGRHMGFKVHYRGSQGTSVGYSSATGVPRGCQGSQGVSEKFKRSQGIFNGYRAFQEGSRFKSEAGDLRSFSGGLSLELSEMP